MQRTPLPTYAQERAYLYAEFLDALKRGPRTLVSCPAAGPKQRRTAVADVIADDLAGEPLDEMLSILLAVAQGQPDESMELPLRAARWFGERAKGHADTHAGDALALAMGVE